MTPTRSVLVVGGTSGIGLATAARLATTWRVFAAGRTKRELPVGVRFLAMDVLDSQSVEDGLAQVGSQAAGRLDAIVYSTGITRPRRPIVEFDLDQWNTLWNTNVTGAILCLKHGYPLLKAAKGKVVLVSSVAAQSFSRYSTFEYTASKAALAGLARQLSMDWVGDGILVNAVYPAMTLTPLLEGNLSPEALAGVSETFPTGALIRPDEVARAIEFLIDPANVSLTGSGIDVNGGILLR